MKKRITNKSKVSVEKEILTVLSNEEKNEILGGVIVGHDFITRINCKDNESK